MAYDAEKARFASIITAATGIPRIRDADLEREATERAFEARQQTGLNVGDEDGPDAIEHPTSTERAARLGVPPSPAIYTAELAIWKYLVRDPVASLANGLLDSTPHRAVLNNDLFTHWGIGIYTEMPPGETDEILRRWWCITWLASEAVGDVAFATPNQKLSKVVRFYKGTHWGYKFSWDGKILGSKSLTIANTSPALASGRGKIMGRPGDWLLMGNGALAGYWVSEDGFFHDSAPKLTS